MEKENVHITQSCKIFCELIKTDNISLNNIVFILVCFQWLHNKSSVHVCRFFFFVKTTHNFLPLSFNSTRSSHVWLISLMYQSGMELLTRLLGIPLNVTMAFIMAWLCILAMLG